MRLTFRLPILPSRLRARAALRGLLAGGLVLLVQSTPTLAQGGQGPESGLPEVNGWAIVAPLLAPASEQAVVEHLGKIYVIGGYPPGRIPVSDVQVYDAATNRWQYGPPLPVPMHHAMAVSVAGRLFVIGGEFDGGGTGRPEIYLDTVYELSQAGDGWALRSPMPTGRSAGGAAVINGKVYVAGGRVPRGKDFAVYDVAADRWETLPDLPTGRNHLGVGAVDGKVYVAGGRFGSGFNSERTAVLEIFDPATGVWTEGPPLPGPRGGVASVVANGCLFVIGGEGNYQDVRGLSVENEAFDPRTGTWHSLPPMPTPTHGLVGAAFVSGRIHIPGGSVTIGGGTGSVIHQVYRPSLTCT